MSDFEKQLEANKIAYEKAKKTNKILADQVSDRLKEIMELEDES